MGTKESEVQAESAHLNATPGKSVMPFVTHRLLNAQEKTAAHQDGVPPRVTARDFVFHEAEAVARLPV